MLNRRSFMINSGIVIAGTLLSGDAFASASYNKKKIGIQLYSLREEIPAGIEGVFKKIAAAGYNSVELYGYNTKEDFFKKSPKELCTILKEHKIIAPSGHYQIDLFDNDGQQSIDAALEVGHKYMVIPFLPESIRKTLDGYKKVAEKINKAALLCKQNNIKLAYHNHDFEFIKMQDDVCGYDILLNETDKNLVQFEMDIFWIVTAGKNPIEMFQQHPGRFKLWHVKDKDKSNPKLNTEIGSGSIDFKPIFEQAKLSGMEYYYVEQENFAIPSDDSIRKSNDFIKKQLL